MSHYSPIMPVCMRCVYAVGRICSIWKHFPWPHLSENLTFTPFFRCLLQRIYENIDVCVYVCVCVMFQEWRCLIRTSLPAHPDYPHNPLARETACNSLRYFAVAKCCSTTLTVWVHNTHNQSSVFKFVKIVWHTVMCECVCVCVNACWFGGDTEVLFSISYVENIMPGEWKVLVVLFVVGV